jgi:hypothetical protein
MGVSTTSIVHFCTAGSSFVHTMHDSTITLAFAAAAARETIGKPTRGH